MQTTTSRFSRSLQLVTRLGSGFLRNNPLCLAGSQHRLIYGHLGNTQKLKKYIWSQANSRLNLYINLTSTYCHRSSLSYIRCYGTSMSPFRCYGHSLLSVSCNGVRIQKSAWLSTTLQKHFRLYSRWTRSGTFIKVTNFPSVFVRYASHDKRSAKESLRVRSLSLYGASLLVFMLGMAYAGVPLYKLFCQSAGLGGTAIKDDTNIVETMTPIRDRVITVQFNADVSSMQWNFQPQQTEIKVVPGETALAFYKAKNPTDEAIIGISTYNILPYEAGIYFNKIQCFCFEEQILNPHEEVDLPVFFYIDPEFNEDPRLEHVDRIILSYMFFKAQEGLTLPLPGFMRVQR